MNIKEANKIIGNFERKGWTIEYDMVSQLEINNNSTKTVMFDGLHGDMGTEDYVFKSYVYKPDSNNYLKSYVNRYNTLNDLLIGVAVKLSKEKEF